MSIKSVLAIAIAAVMSFVSSAASLREFVYGDIVLEPEDSMFFSLEDMADEIGGYEVMGEYLPDGVEIMWTGKKFKLPKKGKVKYSKKEQDFVATSDENPAGLSISISKKKGTVKGSFKVYVAKSEKKLKAYTAKISGKLDGVLLVTIKKVGSWAATID